MFAVMKRSRDLIATWAVLVGLSLATTAFTLVQGTGLPRYAIAGGVLILAFLKARLVLRRYLALSRSRFWSNGFDAALCFFIVVCFGLFVSAG